MKSAFLVYLKDLKEKIISKNLGGLNLCKKVEGEYDIKEFLESFNNMLNVGSPQNIEIKAPAIDLNKDEIVKLGDEIKAPMELSYSCYTGHEKHCGVCESCMRRKRAFKLADVKDPSEYNE